MRFSSFPVLPGSAEAQVICGGIAKRLLIAYFIGNISTKKYQNAFTYVKVIANQRWDVFKTQCILTFSCVFIHFCRAFSYTAKMHFRQQLVRFHKTAKTAEYL